MRKLIFTAVAAMFLLSGCAQVISEEMMKTVDMGISFEKLRENPDSLLGKRVLLGGTIAAARNTKDGGELEIVQFNLERNGVPEDTFHSAGRFIAVSTDFLDPLIYQPGRMATLVGEVKGKKVMPLDEVDYTYPVVAIREIHLWKPIEDTKGYPYPTPGFYNYDPYYWGYTPGPYWYRPPGPVFKRY